MGMKPMPHILRAIRQGRIRRDNACGKHGFTLDKAIRQAGRRERDTGIPFKWYECPFCGSWHLAKDRHR